jgi:predicted DCC family thiol-disulfide oxidoreductase YuxK
MTEEAILETHQLPSWQDHPGRIGVIYDGECRFCRRGVEQLAKLDWSHRLAFISLHDPLVARQWPHLSHDELMEQMYVVTPSGDCLGGARGIRYLSRKLVALWWLAPWMNVPGTLPIWQFLYRIVARMRYRIAGRIGGANCENGTCSLHAHKTKV